MSANQEDKDIYHSGKRLRDLRVKHKGFNQDELTAEPRFPKIDTRTLSRWESQGIPTKRIHEVADYFELPVSVFKHPAITQKEIEQYAIDKDPAIFDSIEELKYEKTTDVLIVKSDIHNKMVGINFEQVLDAVQHRSILNPEGFIIKLHEASNRQNLQKNQQYLEEKFEVFKSSLQSRKEPHISIFALASIPILMHLGKLIGDTIPLDLFQHHRKTKNWCWPTESQQLKFDVIPPNQRSNSDNIALLLSLSGKISRQKIEKNLNTSFNFYEICIQAPHTGFLTHPSMIGQFADIFRETLGRITSDYPDLEEIHLFPAVPAPIAVTCGQSFLPADPTIKLYDCKSSGYTYSTDLKL